MIKKLFVLFLLITLASCSMFFDREKTDRDGIGINALALSDGSGYISTDEYNEITPYVFNDTNTGKKWLFFASDRGGSYDIYYSEIDKDGKCSSPVKMGETINDSGDQHSPVVFYGQYNESSYGYFLIYASGFSGLVNFYVYHLNSDFSVNQMANNYEYSGITGLSLKNKTSLYPTLLIAFGDTQWYEWTWDASMNGSFYSQYNNTLSNVNVPLHSVDGYFEMTLLDYDFHWYVFSALINGKQQIYAGSYDSYGANNFYKVIPYSSEYNDKDPVIDEEDHKVYFASDRYGKGNFDLYRYNLVRYDAVKAPMLSTPQLFIDNLLYPAPIQISWSAVPGAAYYRIFRGVGAEPTFVELTSVAGLSYVDTDVIQGADYYYMIQAVNSFGVSMCSYYDGGNYNNIQ